MQNGRSDPMDFAVVFTASNPSRTVSRAQLRFLLLCLIRFQLYVRFSSHGSNDWSKIPIPIFLILLEDVDLILYLLLTWTDPGIPSRYELLHLGRLDSRGRLYVGRE